MCPFLVFIVMLWCSTAIAVEIFPEDTEREKVGALYSNLGQNIGEEAGLYAEYSDYRKKFRLEIFWDEIERLNLERDEMILTIRFLEKDLIRQVSERIYEGTNRLGIASGPEYLSGLFSHWRPFYFLISGGFFLINAILLMTVLCIGCQRSDIQFMISNIKKRVSDENAGMRKIDSSDYGILREDSEHKKAA